MALAAVPSPATQRDFTTDHATFWAVVFLGTANNGLELALKKMDTGSLDSEDVQTVRHTLRRTTTGEGG